MPKTAMEVALAMDLPDYAKGALRPGLHPQYRTVAFHKFYNAPMMTKPSDRRMSHMSDERHNFRLGFILEEFKEILRDGFGIEMVCSFFVDKQERDAFVTTLSYEGLGQLDLAEALDLSPVRDVVEVVDGLGDINVVVNGYAIEIGIHMDPVDAEICASNFTKADENGQPIIGDGVTGPVGKVLKGPNFVKPQLEYLLGFSCKDEGCELYGTSHDHGESDSVEEKYRNKEGTSYGESNV